MHGGGGAGNPGASVGSLPEHPVNGQHRWPATCTNDRVVVPAQLSFQMSAAPGDTSAEQTNPPAEPSQPTQRPVQFGMGCDVTVDN